MADTHTLDTDDTPLGYIDEGRQLRYMNSLLQMGSCLGGGASACPANWNLANRFSLCECTDMNMAGAEGEQLTQEEKLLNCFGYQANRALFNLREREAAGGWSGALEKARQILRLA